MKGRLGWIEGCIHDTMEIIATQSTMSFEATTLRVPGNYINCHEDSEINDHTRAVPIILMHSYDISSE